MGMSLRRTRRGPTDGFMMMWDARPPRAGRGRCRRERVRARGCRNGACRDRGDRAESSRSRRAGGAGAAGRADGVRAQDRRWFRQWGRTANPAAGCARCGHGPGPGRHGAGLRRICFRQEWPTERAGAEAGAPENGRDSSPPPGGEGRRLRAERRQEEASPAIVPNTTPVEKGIFYLYSQINRISHPLTLLVGGTLDEPRAPGDSSGGAAEAVGEACSHLDGGGSASRPALHVDAGRTRRKVREVFLFLFLQKKKILFFWPPATSMTDATVLRKDWIASLRSQ